MGNSCSSLNCLNGGKCLTGIAGNGFCSCLNGYTGKLCQTCNSNSFLRDFIIIIEKKRKIVKFSII